MAGHPPSGKGEQRSRVRVKGSHTDRVICLLDKQVVGCRLLEARFSLIRPYFVPV